MVQQHTFQMLKTSINTSENGAGAIVFTNTHEKIEIEPLEAGFQNENYEIETMKLIIKFTLANKIAYHRNSTKQSLKDYIQERNKKNTQLKNFFRTL